MVLKIIREMLKRPEYEKIMTRDYVRHVIEAAPMHDIGKISTPDRILQKPGKLDDEEFEIMKQHSVRGSEIITANSMFEDGVNLGNICHKIQPSLETVISNCAKRPIGSNGGFGYKGLKADIEISLMDSVILAHWSAKTTKTTKKQKINY